MTFSSIKNLFIFFAFAVLCSCTTARVKVNYNDEIDFLDFKTFAWLKPIKKDGESYVSLGEQSVRKTINDALNSKGFQEVHASKADILVTTNVTKKEKVHYNANPAFFNSYYGPRWGYSTFWYGPEYYTESTFVLAFVEPKTKQSLWEGYIKNSSFDNMKELDIQKIVDAFFNYFPPLPSADFDGYDKLEDIK